MHSDFLDFFPINIHSGIDFLIVYAVLAAIGVPLLIVVRRVYGSHVDTLAVTSSSTVARLAIGKIPTADQLYSIAYLRRGDAGVASTLLAIANSIGSLRPNPQNPKSFLISLQPTSADQTILRSFLFSLTGSSPTETADPEAAAPAIEKTATEVNQAAKSTAASFSRQIQNELRASGMLRSPETQSKIVGAVWLAGSLLLAIGGLRLARAIALDHRYLFLLVELALVATAIMLVGKGSQESSIKKRYLDWLRDTTGSLRINVQTGFTTTPEAVGLGVAMDGAAILGSAAIAGGLIYAFQPSFTPTPTLLHPHSPHHVPSRDFDVYFGDTDSSDSSTGGSSWGSSDGGSNSGGSDSGGSDSGGSDSGGSSSGGDSGGGGGGDSGGSGCGGGGGGCGGGGGGCGGGG